MGDGSKRLCHRKLQKAGSLAEDGRLFEEWLCEGRAGSWGLSELKNNNTNTLISDITERQ